MPVPLGLELLALVDLVAGVSLVASANQLSPYSVLPNRLSSQPLALA